MGIKFANFARATVATPPTGTGGLVFTVAAGKGALFPVLSAGDYFYGVFTNAGKTAYELVKVTGRSGDSLTIDAAGRGLDGTAAQVWLANDLFLLPPTKKMFEDVFSNAFTALVGLVPAANKIAYFTGAASAALADFTATARTILALAFLARGDTISGSAADTAVVTSVGPDGYSYRALSTAPGGVAWQPHGLPPGIPLPYLGNTEPAGFVFAVGTIGDAASGGTRRANADTLGLYRVLWNSVADAEAPVSGGRGANADADFAAHKTLTIPDYSGKGFLGRDNMGGAAAGITTLAISGVDATKLGLKGGDQRTPAHQHTGTTGDQDRDHNHPGGGRHFGGNQALQDNQIYSDAGDSPQAGAVATGGASQGHLHPFTTDVAGAGVSQNIGPVVVSNIIITL